MLIKMDIKTKSSTGKGILGTVLAFAGANEEQGRKTLHQHWQIWVKELSQTLRNSLFHKNVEIKDKARRMFFGIIDRVVCASYGQGVCITHRCVDQNNTYTMKHDIPQNIFKQKESDIFRQARNKDACEKVKGEIMYCEDCDKTISTVDIINQSLQTWRDSIITGERA